METQVYHLLLIAMLILAPLTALVLLRVDAPYGRQSRSGWGRLISNRWGWFLMESPSALFLAPVAWLSGVQLGGIFLIALWEVHYVHRALIFPWRLHESRTVPLSIVASAVFFNLINVYLNGRALGSLGPGYPLAWLATPQFIVGAILFVAGLAINLDSDNRLLALKRAGQGYVVPRGGLFRWVSSPNYLGEMIEWTGWAIATWNLAGLTFAIWTIANLAPRARSHHAWYRKKFVDYPKHRRALLPFIY